MKIQIEPTNRRRMVFRLPTGLLCSPTFIRLALRQANRHDPDAPKISRKKLRELRAIVRRFRRNHRDWTLVEVKSSNDDSVKIII